MNLNALSSAAALQRYKDINDLNACLKDFRLGGTSRQRRWSPMHRTPFDIGQCRFAIYGIAKYVEHPRENRFAHRRFQRPACILHRHAASETLRRRQRNPAHVTRTLLRQHFDDDLLFRSREQHRINRRQMLVEPYVHDTAAHRDDHAEEWALHSFLSEHIQTFCNSRISPTNAASDATLSPIAIRALILLRWLSSNALLLTLMLDQKL